MTRNVIFGFFSALAGVSLVSGQGLGAVELDRRLYGYELEPEPASWCFTYYSCYLAPLETPQYPLPGGVVTTITSIVQIPTLYPTFPTPTLTTSLPGLPSPSPPLSPSPSPSPLPGPVDIILAIIPTVSGRSREKRALENRDLGGFISEVGSPNPKNCRSATVYRLDSARLQLSARLSASIFANAGTSFTEFRTRESLNVGANIVATAFLDDNSVLRWRNPSFSGGEAGFCQVPATGQVYATYVASPTQWPAGCLPIRLSILRRDQCVDGSTTPGPLPSTTSISTAVISTQSSGPSSSSGLPQTTPVIDSSTTIASSAVPTSLSPLPTTSSSVPESSSLDSSTQSTFSPATRPTSEASSTTPESTTGPIIPPETSSTSDSIPLPPVTSSTRTPSTSVSSSSLSSGSTQSTPSTRSTQSTSSGSTSRTASTGSTSRTASTGSTSQTASTGSTSRTASTGSTSQTASTGSTSQTASTRSTSQTVSTGSTPSITSTGSISTGTGSTIFPSSTGFANSTTSGPPNLCANGDFENGNIFPWYIISSTGISNSAVVPSGSTPGFVNHPDGGQYALKLGFVDNTVPNTLLTLDIGNSVQTVFNHRYSISFDGVGCGSPGDTVVVSVNTQTISSLLLTGANCATWATYTGTFVGTGLDTIKVSILSSAAAGLNQFYFDNFVVTEA